MSGEIYVPNEMQGLYENVLKPTELIVLLRLSQPIATITKFYTKLTSNWILRISLARSTDDIGEKHHQADLEQLINHVYLVIMSDQAAASENDTIPEASMYVWRYASINHASRVASMVLPSPKILYNFLFNSALQDMSGICAILAIYKIAFEERHNLGFHYTKDVVDQFNGNLMNVCNVIWRSRAFLASDANINSHLCSETLAKELQSYLAQIDLDYSLSFIFGLSHNPMLAALSAASFRALEETADMPNEPLNVRHEGPVTQRSLAKLVDEGGLDVSWQSYRVNNLKWLDSHGVSGIKRLMYVTIKDLMRSKM